MGSRIRSSSLLFNARLVMVHKSWGPNLGGGSAIVDVVYVTLDRGYCLGGEKRKEYLADAAAGENSVSGVARNERGIVGAGG